MEENNDDLCEWIPTLIRVVIFFCVVLLFMWATP